MCARMFGPANIGDWPRGPAVSLDMQRLMIYDLGNWRVYTHGLVFLVWRHRSMAGLAYGHGTGFKQPYAHTGLEKEYIDFLAQIQLCS